MTAVWKRELQQFFLSPLGYIFIGGFMLFSGIIFTMTNLAQSSSNLNNLFGTLQMIMCLLIPVLTMRLLSDERRNKTDQLLLTSPLSVWDIALGKFFAAATVYFITLVLALIYPITVAALGTLAVGEMIAIYLGFFLLGCAFIAVGLFFSSLVESQIVAFILTFVAILLLMLMDSIISIIPIPVIPTMLSWLSIFQRFTYFQNGLISLAAVVYMISFCGVFIFLSVRMIERRRWSEA